MPDDRTIVNAKIYMKEKERGVAFSHQAFFTSLSLA
jgi:hypothetical protein